MKRICWKSMITLYEKILYNMHTSQTEHPSSCQTLHHYFLLPTIKYINKTWTFAKQEVTLKWAYYIYFFLNVSYISFVTNPFILVTPNQLNVVLIMNKIFLIQVFMQKTNLSTLHCVDIVNQLFDGVHLSVSLCLAV